MPLDISNNLCLFGFSSMKIEKKQEVLYMFVQRVYAFWGYRKYNGYNIKYET